MIETGTATMTLRNPPDTARFDGPADARDMRAKTFDKGVDRNVWTAYGGAGQTTEGRVL